MLVRRERREDVDAVREVVAAAFAGDDGREPIEVGLLARLREDPGWLPAFSLVATEPDGPDEPDGPGGPGGPGETVVGYVVATRGDVDGRPALGLGPVAVHPKWQGRGVGSALMHAFLGAAEGRDEAVVALLGEPAFYGRFGFRPATEHGIASPDPAWGTSFQVRPFAKAAPRGFFRYAAPFADL